MSERLTQLPSVGASYERIPCFSSQTLRAARSRRFVRVTVPRVGRCTAAEVFVAGPVRLFGGRPTLRASGGGQAAPVPMQETSRIGRSGSSVWFDLSGADFAVTGVRVGFSVVISIGTTIENGYSDGRIVGGFQRVRRNVVL